MKHQARRFGLAQLFFHIFAVLPLLALPLGGASADQPQTPGRVVNCDHGGRLAVAVRNARPGDTIRFKGTCYEQVTITTDRLTLDGQQGEGIIDGSGVACPTLESGTKSEKEEIVGLVEIDAAQGVTLEGLTVQHSDCDGIFFRGSSATLRDVIVYDSRDDGIDSEQAEITLEDSSLTGNTENGMNLDNNSTANIFKGTVSFVDNPRFGVLNNHSLLFVSSGATLNASDVPNTLPNQQIGIGVFAGGELMGYTDSKMIVQGNSAQGLLFINSGMFLSYSTTEIAGNGVGITLVDGSTFTQTSGTLTILGNFGFGIAAENSTVAMRQASSDDGVVVQIVNNHQSPDAPPVDVSLTFGTRATLERVDSVNIGYVYCGEGVLVQGFACPGQ